MPLGWNKVLGNPSTPEAARPHRVAMGDWPSMVTDPRTESFEKLAAHVAQAGYEGFEFGTNYLVEKFFPSDNRVIAARKARRIAEDAGLKFFGSTLFVSDQQMRSLNWVETHFKPQLDAVVELGCGFASYQVSLHPDYVDTGGAYRQDEGYLRWVAERLTELRQGTWDMGLNFYLETHINKVTEDPQALCRILDMCSCEINGDLSHYLYRKWIGGPHLKRVLSQMGHTHVRMCRLHGDLSAVVADPRSDWANGGPTWWMFKFMMQAVSKGLSSRTITGETGPAFQVTKSLDQDASLVPLYRAIARYADAAAQGIALKVEKPDDLKPWG